MARSWAYGVRHGMLPQVTSTRIAPFQHMTSDFIVAINCLDDLLPDIELAVTARHVQRCVVFLGKGVSVGELVDALPTAGAKHRLSSLKSPQVARALTGNGSGQ